MNKLHFTLASPLLFSCMVLMLLNRVTYESFSCVNVLFFYDASNHILTENNVFVFLQILHGAALFRLVCNTLYNLIKTPLYMVMF